MTLSGPEAETRACDILRAAGYRIVARNWRSRFGEIDIIARDGDTLAFIEVKARAQDGYGGAAAAVDEAKQRRISLTAALFMQETSCDLPARFDVVAMTPQGTDILRDAFRIDEPCSRG